MHAASYPKYVADIDGLRQKTGGQLSSKTNLTDTRFPFIPIIYQVLM